MLRLVADENFNNDIVWGLVRRLPTIDIVRIQDVGLSGADDTAILAWAAQEDRILLTHDAKTITAMRMSELRQASQCLVCLRSDGAFPLAL